MILVTGAGTGIAYGIVWIGARIGIPRAIRLEKKLHPFLVGQAEPLTLFLHLYHEPMVAGIFFSLSINIFELILKI